MFGTELSCKNVKSRGRYKCSWCNEYIENKEIHQSRVYVNLDGITRIREHLECSKAMESLQYDEEYEFGQQKRGLNELR